VLYWLSGLTCTEDNFMHKAAAFEAAAAADVIIVCPDTSPRGTGIAGETESWDFGAGAGFYINATQDKVLALVLARSCLADARTALGWQWKTNYNMYDYVTKELPALVAKELPVTERKSSARS
jgi:S-formylglutathione hydrolase